MPINRLCGALAAGMLFATALPALAADPEHAVYAVTAQNGSDEVGTVTLTPMGEKTRVDVALVNAPEGAQPAHIHEGTCAKLNPSPKYPLTVIKDGVSSSTVNAPMSQLIAGGFAVNVHKSTTDIATYVACGDLTNKK